MIFPDTIVSLLTERVLREKIDVNQTYILHVQGTTYRSVISGDDSVMIIVGIVRSD